MINRGIDNYSLLDDEPTWPENIERAAKLNFAEVCNTILHSDDPAAVSIAYNKLFREYKNSIIYALPSTSISSFEDVIYKTLDDAYSDTYYTNGEMYSPFVRLVAIARDQEHFKFKTYDNRGIRPDGRLRAVHNPLRHIDNYILNYAMFEDNPTLNNYVHLLLNSRFSN